ncbi:MAG: hypothetical protein ACK559_36860, partial [bacterium]
YKPAPPVIFRLTDENFRLNYTSPLKFFYRGDFFNLGAKDGIWRDCLIQKQFMENGICKMH